MTKAENDRGLDGKTIFVTGAANGIGKSVAVSLAKAGANLAVFDLEAQALDKVADELAQTGVKVSRHSGNVADMADVKAAIAETVRIHGGLDGAVNNAGILGVTVPLLDYPADVFRAVIDVNLLGVLYCMQAELAILVPQKRGSIVNIASAAGVIGWPGASAYVASKHAVVGLTKTAGLEYGKQGVRVNAVCPAFIYSNMTDKIFEADGAHDAAVAAHPIGRIGNGEEVAEAVMWLLSDRSSFSAGSSLIVDGGYTAQ